ncbi:NUDIX domain-containing protein [Streptomyces sp. NPDC097640]|uniref:NUDIX hydrolase n=1 Tax=Streptomyces sp. NPDC097640 TaxID=3157229 RepID=UPI0033197733
MTDGGNGTAPLESVAWVCVRDGRLLAVRTRGRDAFYLPGGKLEPGEDGPRALARELAEELGLTAVPATQAGPAMPATSAMPAMSRVFVIEDEAHGQGGRRLRMTCYTGEAQGEPTPGREIAELAWLTAQEADRCAPALRQVLRRLVAEGRVRHR